MDTAFFFPSEPLNKLTIETTVSLEKGVGEHADVFIEYVGDYPEHGPRPIFLNSGGAYRLTKTEQLDFHLAVGLDNSAPDYIFGLGYSFRVDGLFQSMSITVRTDEPSCTAVVACRSRELRKENERKSPLGLWRT